MPRGDKSAYTSKQKRQAVHIEEGYEERGVSKDEAERRAWSTVNKQTGGGKKRGAGRATTKNVSRSSAGRQSKKSSSSQARKQAVVRNRNVLQVPSPLGDNSIKLAHLSSLSHREQGQGEGMKRRKFCLISSPIITDCNLQKFI